jgi:hypothetical protein
MATMHGYLRQNSSSFAGYFERIMSALVEIPFSRQALKTSRLSSTVLRQPRLLTPPVRMRTNTSGK